MEFLGFRVDSRGLHSTDEKVDAILRAPVPKNVKDLQAFNVKGFVNFLARFLPSTAAALHPLYGLLKKETPWSWSKECNQAFNNIKTIVRENRSLAHYNPNYPIRLKVDGSDYGLGAVISQKIDGIDKPLAFASRTLSTAEERYSQLHK